MDSAVGTDYNYVYYDYHNVKLVGESVISNGSVEDRNVCFYIYDTYGNVTEKIVSGGTLRTPTVIEYADYGNYVKSVTDSAGNTTTYEYDINTGVLLSVQYPGDTDSTKTTYEYDEMYRLVSTTANSNTGLTMSAEYAYSSKDLLTSISTPSTTYNFTYYDTFGMRKTVSVGNQTLIKYEYNDERYINKLDYSNNDTVKYTYDTYDRVLTESYFNDSATTADRIVTYDYDNNGNVAKIHDSKTGITKTYHYDFAGRVTQITEKGDGHDRTLKYGYSGDGNLVYVQEYINGQEYNSYYQYDELNRVGATAYSLIVNSAGDSLYAQGTYTYDDFDRITKFTVAHYIGEVPTTVLTRSLTYRTVPKAGYSDSTDQVSRLTNTYGSTSKTYTYTYDANGNILSDGSNSYVYDSANQLIRENNPSANLTWVWTYDDAGNILSKKAYPYTTETLGSVTGTVTYNYGNSNWGDQLTVYNGKPISYDTVGNPISDGTWSYTWQQGRQLTRMSNGTTTWTYTYDADGMRTKRTNGTTTYTYVYNGGQLSQMTYGSYVLSFAYDASGTPMAVSCNGALYYYVTNLQGDVVAIIDNSGTQVVGYTYDAWGRIVHMSDTSDCSLGGLNPLRYRGYVYDRETGLYYLQSRYYNPTWGRFLNADGYTSTGQRMLGNNMYAYCNNNPVNYVDPAGEFPWLIALAIVAIVVLIPSDTNQAPKYEAAATQKYNENTIDMSVNEIGTDPNKLNVTFYPDAGLIHIEESYSIASEYEKRAVIDVIMNSDHYDPTVYGNSVDTMLMEWSGHNFVYHTASSSDWAYWAYQKVGYETPIESTRGVDFRKQLAPSAERNYKLITLWGLLQW